MEKYKSEVLVTMSHEELENVVLSLQTKMDETEKNRKMYQGWKDEEVKKREIAEKRLEAVRMMLGTWE